MEDELQLPFTYERADVVAAQRLRLLYSRRLRLLLLVGLAAVVVLVLQLSGLRMRLAGSSGGWSTPIAVGAFFVLIVTLAYLLAPIIEFQVNSGWRSAVILRVDPDGLQLSGPTSATAFELAWPQVIGLLENENVWLLFFGGEQDFLIVPKRIFRRESQLAFFRSMLETQDFVPG